MYLWLGSFTPCRHVTNRLFLCSSPPKLPPAVAQRGWEKPQEGGCGATTSAHTAPHPEGVYFPHLRNTLQGFGFECCATGSVWDFAHHCTLRWGESPARATSLSLQCLALTPAISAPYLQHESWIKTWYLILSIPKQFMIAPQSLFMSALFIPVLNDSRADRDSTTSRRR